jgi:pyruvate/2-oxoglutarate dehydrogenase complex dihydrolipoamide acyltransferase (E2) component
MATRKVDKLNMTNNKQLSVVDSIIEFCQKQMDNDSSIHKGVYLSIIKFCKEQAKAMHKTEHFNTWWHGISENEPITFEQYYNETYGGGEQ